MHELSIAVILAEEAERHCRLAGAGRVVSLTVRIGILCGVHAAALQKAFAAVPAGMSLAGARLVVHESPVGVWCRACRQLSSLTDLRRLACPHCGGPSEIRSGNELELEALELELPSPAVPETMPV
jgi:hydrogenase nickel incorporation protein HypA/HybF